MVDGYSLHSHCCLLQLTLCKHSARFAEYCHAIGSRLLCLQDRKKKKKQGPEEKKNNSLSAPPILISHHPQLHKNDLHITQVTITQCRQRSGAPWSIRQETRFAPCDSRKKAMRVTLAVAGICLDAIESAIKCMCTSLCLLLSPCYTVETK